MGQTTEEVNYADGEEILSHKCQTYFPSNIHPENIQILKKVKHKTDITKSANDEIINNGKSENVLDVEYIKYHVINNAKEPEEISKWLQDLHKKLDFLYVQSASELILDDDIEKEAVKRICDLYGFIENDKILEVKNMDTDQTVEKIQGKCIVTLKNGDECVGNWRQGKRFGKGSITGPILEKLGISHLSGNYENGILTGKGRLVMDDNSILEGWFQQGFLHGPAKGTHSNGQVSWVGWYNAGLPVGTCWQSVLGDAWLVGKVNKDGKMTGDDIAFLYPDLSTALLGTFEEGVLESAVPAVVDIVRLVDGVLEVDFKNTGSPVYKRWLSTKNDVACPHHQGDIYERSRVEVRMSTVEGAGEGLYANVDLEPGMVVSYYNGLKMKPGEKSLEQDTGYAIFIDFARTWQEKQNIEHMDIPAKYQSTSNYSATLGHKVNHSFDPNLVFDVAEHPCYGRIPALRTLRKVRAGDELCAHYSMDMEDAYDWYRDAWQVYSTGGHQIVEMVVGTELDERSEEQDKCQLDSKTTELDNLEDEEHIRDTSKECKNMSWVKHLEAIGKNQKEFTKVEQSYKKKEDQLELRNAKSIEYRSEHIEEEENESKQHVEYPIPNKATEQESIRKWLNDLNTKIEFIYVHSASELVLDNSIEEENFNRICDPYQVIQDDKTLEVINTNTEQTVEKIQGKCTVTLKNGDECEGSWRQRKRMGKGSITGPTLQRLGISHLFGNYENGILTGKGRLSMVDNSILEGWFQQGFLHGPAKGNHRNGQVSWVGWYHAGLAVGTCWQSVVGDAWLVGMVNKDGRMTGDDIAFLYPDLTTALLGRFEEGVLVSAVPAVVDMVRLVDGVMEVDFKKTGGPVYMKWLSTKYDIACPPHQGDMYERSKVEVRVSTVEGAGEGLYAKVDLEPDMVVAYYNGLKMKPGEKSLEKDTGYGIFIDSARTWQEKQNTEHMDIPAKYQSTSDYSATLGHKVNHSFDPNLVFDVAEHPCYGRVPVLRTLQKVRAGEELCAHYSMDMEDAYDWYREAWQVYSTGGHQI